MGALFSNKNLEFVSFQEEPDELYSHVLEKNSLYIYAEDHLILKLEPEHIAAMLEVLGLDKKASTLGRN